MEFKVKRKEFTSEKGNKVEVFDVHAWNEDHVILTTPSKIIRTYVSVNGFEFDIEPGCSFKSESAVRAVGL